MSRVLAYAVVTIFSFVASLILTQYVLVTYTISAEDMYAVELSKLASFLASQLIYTYYHCANSDVELSVVLPREVAGYPYLVHIQQGSITITLDDINVKYTQPLPTIIISPENYLVKSTYKNVISLSCTKGSKLVLIS